MRLGVPCHGPAYRHCQQRRRHSVATDIKHIHSQESLIELHDIEQVPAECVTGLITPVEVHMSEIGRRFWKEGPLHLYRSLEFVVQAISVFLRRFVTQPAEG